MSVCLIHPQIQHSHQVAWALAEADLLECYVTSCFFSQKLINLLPGFLKNQLRKRSHKNIPFNKVKTLFYPEVIWKLFGKIHNGPKKECCYYRNVWMFDRLIARHIKCCDARVVVGYENSCLNIFSEANKLAKITVLDAASVHYLAQKEVYTPKYSSSFLDKINRRKQEEIDLADHILVLSDYARQTYVRAGVPSEKIRVINLGVDVARFPFLKRDEDTTGINYLFVGNVKLSKGVDLLLKSFSMMKDTNNRLTIVGAPGDASDLLKNLPCGVHLKNHMSQDELLSEYRKADVFVLPSRLDGFGMVVAEAMATGLPVIISSHVGAADIVTEGENGWVFTSGNVEELHQCMSRASNDITRLRLMGVHARNSVIKRSWQVYRQEIASFYSDLLQSHG